MLPGFIGGNRMTKKTQNRGRAPMPFQGSFADLEGQIATLLELYHDKPQSKRSHLAGQSPNQRLRQHLAAGWAPTSLVDDGMFGAVFCTRRRAKIYAGGYFEADAQTWQHDDLLDLAGTSVTLHKPLFGDRRRIFVFDDQDRALICQAEPAEPFAWGDRAAAGEQARRATKLRRKIRKLEEQASQADPMAAIAATVGELGGTQLPEGAQAISSVRELPRRPRTETSFELWLKAARKAG
jgi:hypothetical protein